MLRAAGECGRKLPLALLLVGDGARRQKLQMIAEQYRNVAVVGPIADRSELAILLASADGLVLRRSSLPGRSFDAEVQVSHENV